MMQMIFEEKLMGRIIKVEVEDDVVADIKTKYYMSYLMLKR